MSRFTSGARTPVVVLLAMTAAVLLGSLPALAHSELVDQSPAPEAVLEKGPTTVVAIFTEELDPASSLTITGPDGHLLASGPGGLDLDDLEHVTLRKEFDAVPGTYTVEWVATSADDGDSTGDSWEFSVADATGVVPAPADSDGSSAVAITVLMLSIAMIAALATARRLRNDRDHALSKTLALLIVTLVLGSAMPASAHGKIVSSEPAEGSASTTSPEEMRIWISEPVSPKFSTVELQTLDGTTIPIEGLEVGVEGDHGLLTVDLPELSDGTYSAAWTVLSESDGHVTRGLVVFGVGDGTVDRSGFAEPVEELPLPEAIGRWASLLAILLFVGTVSVSRFVLSGHRFVDWPTRVNRLMITWSVLGLGSGLFLLASQAVVLSGLPDQASWTDVVSRLVTATAWGRLWLARELLFGLALMLSLRSRLDRSRGTTAACLLIASGLVTVSALSSHAAGVAGEVALGVTVDAVHLAAASFWVGGLACLVLLGIRFGAPPWRRFGNAAAVAVGLLIATGLYSSGLQVSSLDAAITTSYGRTLITKLAIAGTVGAFGLLNALLVHPRLAAPIARVLGRETGWTPVERSKFPKLVAGELALAVAVVAVTGLLTSLSPANGAEFVPNSAAVDAMSDVVDDMAITLVAQPNLPGDNVLVVHAASNIRPAVAPIDRVLVRFAYADQDLGRRTEQMTEIEPGRFRIGGSQFARAGAWTVDVVVRRRGMPDAVATFDWIVPTRSGSDTIVSDTPLAPALTLGAALILIALTAAVGVIVWRSRQSSASPPASRAPAEQESEIREEPVMEGAIS